MWLPTHDPFVILGIALLGCTIIIAILLLTIVQRGSAEEVWESVDTRPKTDDIAAASARAASEQSSLVDALELAGNETVKIKRGSKNVRFSAYTVEQRYEPLRESSKRRGREDGVDVDLGTAASGQRLSWNQQRVVELHFV